MYKNNKRFFQLTENEQRIFTLLLKHGRMSKRELSTKGKMGWATVVKMVNRLEDTGYIRCVGTSKHWSGSGKNPYIYELVDNKPLAIGIDIGYTNTRTIVINLKNEYLV